MQELRTFSVRLATPPTACSLVYGGAEQQQRSDVSVWRFVDVVGMMGCNELATD